MRSLAPELPTAGSRPLDDLASRPKLPADADAWSTLAAEIAATSDRAMVADAVAALAAAMEVEVDLDGDVVVLQRMFGHLHRRALRG